ncbi:MAG: glycosyltransferase family 4 protein [Candidatus Thermoplasmatota archaeon]|nr:glycosyltransferase family 4 protein [Candidatus Thermoplasmatota archaeon]
MKILWMNHRCIKHPRTGGAERTIFEVGKRLVARGHEVDLLTGGWQGASRHEVIEGVRIHRYGSRILPHVVQPIYLRYHKDADVIVDDMAHAAPWFSPWFSAKPGVVFFRHLHARTLSGQVSPYLALMLSFLEKHYSFIYKYWPFVTESSSSETDLTSLGVELQRIVRIPPGVDTQMFRPGKKTTEPSIVYFGGMRPYKRPEHALIVLNLLRKKGHKVHLTMVGDGPSLPFLKHLSTEFSLDKDVTFTGKVSDRRLSELVSSSWVNLHCSMSEGWGYSMLESAASGTPTVAYRVPGVSDTVREGISGEMVADGDVTGLSDAAERALACAPLLSSAARQYAELYSWEVAADRWEAMLKLSISGHVG